MNHSQIALFFLSAENESSRAAHPRGRRLIFSPPVPHPPSWGGASRSACSCGGRRRARAQRRSSRTTDRLAGSTRWLPQRHTTSDGSTTWCTPRRRLPMKAQCRCFCFYTGWGSAGHRMVSSSVVAIITLWPGPCSARCCWSCPLTPACIVSRVVRVRFAEQALT